MFLNPTAQKYCWLLFKLLKNYSSAIPHQYTAEKTEHSNSTSSARKFQSTWKSVWMKRRKKTKKQTKLYRFHVFKKLLSCFNVDYKHKHAKINIYITVWHFWILSSGETKTQSRQLGHKEILSAFFHLLVQGQFDLITKLWINILFWPLNILNDFWRLIRV